MPDLLGIGTAIQAGVNAAQMISGWRNANKGRKQLNSLLANRPEYEISSGYKDSLGTYQRLANGNMPGYDLTMGQIGQSTAKAMDYAREGAMGSNQYMDAVIQAQDKELEAVRNLGITAAQWRTQQQQALAGAQMQYGAIQDQAWDYNVNQPWQIKANMAAERMSAGQQSGWQGLQGLAGTLQNYAGTEYYKQMMQSMYGQGGVGAPVQLAPPASAVTPTTSWMNYKGQIGQ